MRLIWQGGGLALAAMICFIASGWAFYAEVDFGRRQIEVPARIERLTTHTTQKRTGARSMATFAFTLPDGTKRRAVRRVSTVFSFQHHVGERLTLYVDPADPAIFEINRDEYSSKGLIFGVIGFAAAALSVLSFGTAYAGLLARAKAGA